MKSEAHVLVVDDNENNRYTLSRRLSRLGYQHITEAENGKVALEILEQSPQDIILLDVMMPVMDGFEVLENIKNSPKYANLPVIMISALDDLDKVVKSIEMGADDYLPKPFNATLLAARMKAALRKRKLIKIETNYYKDFDKDTDLAKLEIFTGSLENEMNKQPDTNFSVIFIRFEHYQYICQSLNLSAANHYIKQQALRIKNIIDDDNTQIGRLAEDVIALFNQAKDISLFGDQHNLNQELYTPIAKAVTVDGNELSDNIGIGISMATSRDKNAQALIANAAFASQTALDNGTGIAIYDPQRHQQTVAKFELEPKLKQALKQNQLTMYYQPIVNAASGKIESFEALIRWFDESGQVIPPFEFITLAEETGLILDIDVFVLRQVCQQIVLWRQQFGEQVEFTIGANISAKHWTNTNLVNHVQQLLSEFNIPARYLKLEMTESALVDDAEVVKKIVATLHAIGVKIALDDFGTGYSSLGYLIEFPVDILKIDKVFIDEIETNKQKQQLVKHILAIANSLGMKTIVEGVENEQQATLLKELKCDQIQGYHFYKPQPADTISQLD